MKYIYLLFHVFLCIIPFDILLVIMNINSKSRWFFIHAYVNFIISILCLPGVLLFLKEPYNAFETKIENIVFSPTSKWPLSFSVGLHLYHILFFKLSKEEWFHHIVFLPLLAIPGLIYDWGYFGNWLVFYICGLPGGVDYTILGFQKIGYLKSLNQKRISVNMNTWIRTPGILIGVGIAYLLLMENRCFNVNKTALIIQLIFMPINALYYCKQSTLNYAFHYFQKNTFINISNQCF